MSFGLLNDFLQTSKEERVEVLYRYLVNGESGSFIAEDFYSNKNYAWKISAITQGYCEKGGKNRGKVNTTKLLIYKFVSSYPNGTYKSGITLSDFLNKHQNFKSDGEIKMDDSELNKGIYHYEPIDFAALGASIGSTSHKNKNYSKFELPKLQYNLGDDSENLLKSHKKIKLSKGCREEDYQEKINSLFGEKQPIFQIADASHDVDYNINIGVIIFFYEDFAYMVEKPYFGYSGLAYERELFEDFVLYKNVINISEEVATYIKHSDIIKENGSKLAFDEFYTVTNFVLGTLKFNTYQNEERTSQIVKSVNHIINYYKKSLKKKIFSKFHNTPIKIKYKRPITLVSGTTHDTYNQMLSEMFPNRTVIYELDGFYDVKYQYNCGVKVFFYPDFLYIIEKPYFGNLFNGKEYVEGVSRDWTLFDKLIMYKDINKVHGSYASVHNETKFSTSEWAYSDTYEVTHFYLGEVGEVFSTYRNDDETKKIISTINNIIKTYKGE